MENYLTGWARDFYIFIKFALISLGVIHVMQFAIHRWYEVYPTEEMLVARQLADVVADGLESPGPKPRR